MKPMLPRETSFQWNDLAGLKAWKEAMTQEGQEQSYFQ